MKRTDYDSIAPYYDLFNKGFDHKRYIDTVISHLKKYVSVPFGSSTALDLGCGTGELMKHILRLGFDCCGLDGSEEMLIQASSKDELSECMFVHQDIKDIDLYRAYDLIFCCADVLNHLYDPSDIGRFFIDIFNFAENNGYLIFDLKTETEFAKNSKDEIYEIGSATLRYSGRYDPPLMTTGLEISENGSVYKENIKEKYYSKEEILEYINRSRFRYIESFDYGNDERTIYILKKEL